MEIGFMQGRLCDPVDGKIQAFPWKDWESEFVLGEQLGFTLMEWTLDQDRLYENPLMTETGKVRIRELSAAHRVKIISLTGDCFMQAPFYKVTGANRNRLLADLSAIIAASAELGIRYMVVPLVDNGSLQTLEQEASLKGGLLPLTNVLCAKRMRIVFESDFPPNRLAEFISEFAHDAFGINYDIGNSAALGFDPEEEIGAYGDRIVNVHVKDRVRHGTTVPLGEGDADLPRVFAALKRAGYRGNFILQTARARNGEHAGVLVRYRDIVRNRWDCSGS